jgi:hypothetical protein
MTREESTVKHPKKPELWSNVEISADTDGYLAAQEASWPRRRPAENSGPNRSASARSPTISTGSERGS